MKKSKIYIVLPVFNGEKYILEQLFSIYNQTYSKRKLIIIDDCSVDGTSKLIKKFIKDYSLDKKVFLYKNEKNLGVNYTIEKGLKIIQKESKKDDFVAYCDADDIRTRNKLEKQIEFMNETNCVISYHDLVTIDNLNNIINKSYQLKLISPFCNTFSNNLFEFAMSQHVTSTTMMFKADKIDDLLPFSNAIYQDHWTILVFSILYPNKIKYLNEKMVFYRRHLGSASLKSKDKKEKIQKIINLLEDAYKLTNKKDIKKYINIYKIKLGNTNNHLSSILTIIQIFLKYPFIGLKISTKIMSYPMRKLYGFFYYS